MRWAVLAALGCELVDPRVEQAIAPSTIQRADGARLTADALPAQEWRVSLPGTPAAIFVESVTLRASADLDFLERLVFYVEPLSPGSTLGRRLVAWTQGAPHGRTLSLETARALDITPWVVEGLRLVPEVSGQGPSSDVTVEGDAVLQVDVL